ncbi:MULTISPECIES: AzlD domain-containing protein [Vibrio]|uniref:AzlD domain-containing protein n=1 Tax=Vibrio algicola TaxID=2662262 RepID=A0A5Q0TI28_9VIBR|nr:MULTISPECIES: AzlD domain-containing protein [Vibrio]MBD1576493.1 AzlD domain-containing protein [Vibrio sp. S11_S32]
MHTSSLLTSHYVILLSFAMAVATFAVRFSVIGMAGKFNMSERFKKTLRFVPVTVLPAIIAVEILGTGAHLEFNLHNPKVWAAIVCTLVSLRFGLIWVVVSGLASLIFFEAYLGPMTHFLAPYLG